MFQLLKMRTSIDIFKNEKCKVTFGLEYIMPAFTYIEINACSYNRAVTLQRIAPTYADV